MESGGMKVTRDPKARRKHQGSAMTLAELAPVICIVIPLFVVSVADLFGLCLSYASAYLIALEACAHAANAPNLKSALNNLQNSSCNLLSTNLGKLGRLSAVGGVDGSGADLYILETNIYSGATHVYGPNAALHSVDSVTNVYQMEARCTYQTEPILNASHVLGFGAIPGVGEPVAIKCAVRHVLDRPELFANSSSAVSLVSVPAASDQTQPNGLNVLANWDFTQRDVLKWQPGQQILASSQQVIDATNGNWQPLLDSSGKPLNLKPGYRLTVMLDDSRWADQYKNWVSWQWGDSKAQILNDLRTATLITKIGTDGNTFAMTDHFYNFSYPSAGYVYMRFNDNIWSRNLGKVMVSAYITN